MLTKSRTAALFATSILGFSFLFWLYAHSAEVFQLTLVLLVLSMIFLFKWKRDTAKKIDGSLYLSLFFLGLAVFHHQTVALVIPAYLYLIFNRKVKGITRRQYLFMFGAFSAGAIPYLYDLWESFIKNPYNWIDVLDLKSFWRLVTRSDYGTFTALPSLAGSTIMQRVVQVLWYGKVFIVDFSAVGAFFFIVGLAYLFKKNRSYFWFFFLGWFFTGPFFLFYAAFPINEVFIEGVSERFVLISYLFLSIFIGFGFWGTLRILKKMLLGTYIKNKSVFVFVTLCFFVFPLALAFKNWEKADLSNYQIGGILGHDLMASVDPPGIFFPFGDTPAFNMEVAYFTEKQSPGAKLVLLSKLGDPIYRKQLMAKYPDLIYSDNFRSSKFFTGVQEIKEFFDANLQNVPIYLGGDIGLPSEYKLVRNGMVLRLYKKDDVPDASEIAQNMQKVSSNFTFNFAREKGKYQQFFGSQILNIYSDSFTKMGRELLNRGKDAEAMPYFEKALEIDPKAKNAIFGLGIAYFDQKNCEVAKREFEKLIAIDNSFWQAYEGLAHVYRDCDMDSVKADEFSKKALDLNQGGLLNEKFK